MAFERIAGIPGKCYRPEGCGRRKHPCRDCFSCQFCSEERCALCRAEGRGGRDSKKGGGRAGGESPRRRTPED